MLQLQNRNISTNFILKKVPAKNNQYRKTQTTPKHQFSRTLRKANSHKTEKPIPAKPKQPSHKTKKTNTKKSKKIRDSGKAVETSLRINSPGNCCFWCLAFLVLAFVDLWELVFVGTIFFDFGVPVPPMSRALTSKHINLAGLLAAYSDYSLNQYYTTKNILFANPSPPPPTPS